MNGTDDRSRVGEARADGTPEWEVFLRETDREPLKHAGSVSAPTADIAHEQAGALFPEARTLWLCRSDEVVRFTERTLGVEYADGSDDESPPDGSDAPPAGGVGR